MSSETEAEAAPQEIWPARKPRRGDILEVFLTGLGEKGRAIGYGLAGSPEGKPHTYSARTRDGVPGDHVLLNVHKRRKETVEGHVEEMLEESPDRVEARCLHVASCGGCAFQQLAYGRQLVELRAQLVRTLEPLNPFLGERKPALGPVIGCDEPFAYRNKMDFTFGNKRWRETGEAEGSADDFALGLHARGHFEKVLDVGRCEIAFPEASAILDTVRREAQERELSAWDVRAHEGLLRHLVLRKSWASGEVLADLVTTERRPEAVEPFVAAIRAAHPEIASFVQTVNAGVALVAVGDEEVLAGSGTIEEQLCGLWFRISARSFFQTNTPQAERLAALVSARAEVGPNDTLFDVYCGGGALALIAGQRARVVWGFELVPEAVADADFNAERNGITNARFIAGDVAATLAPDSLDELGAPRPDVCLVDPPRAGVHKDVLRALVTLAPRRIVYVSCNPKSATRDLPVLLQGGYRLLAIDPLDLFPHTPHMECIFTLVADAKAQAPLDAGPELSATDVDVHEPGDMP
ncbi:MAG: 23S rRNA (uracil1939-C5)-methyltransferase [Planctomycetota bacterium]|jgi:23S rRNA (uracil1939-C5)-methyltransferase